MRALTSQSALPYSPVLRASLEEWTDTLGLELRAWQTSEGVNTFDKGVFLACTEGTDQRVRRAVRQANGEELAKRRDASEAMRAISLPWTVPGYENEIVWKASTERGARLVRFAARAAQLQEKPFEKRRPP